MPHISSSLTPAYGVKIDQRARQLPSMAGAGSFDAYLFAAQNTPAGRVDRLWPLHMGGTHAASAASIGDALAGIADRLIAEITVAHGHAFGGQTPQAPYKFPFSAEFESTFGLTGPLPHYIAVLTAGLNLTREQNQAVQDIAIRHKDIVKSPDSVYQVAVELEMAGIGYADRSAIFG